MLKAAAAAGYLNEKDAMLESRIAIKRTGADLTLTYVAVDAAKWLQESKKYSTTGTTTNFAPRVEFESKPRNSH